MASYLLFYDILIKILKALQHEEKNSVCVCVYTSLLLFLSLSLSLYIYIYMGGCFFFEHVSVGIFQYSDEEYEFVLMCWEI